MTDAPDLTLGYVLIDRQDSQDVAVAFDDIEQALGGLDNDDLVDDLAEEDSLDVRLADHGSGLAAELASREIIHHC